MKYACHFLLFFIAVFYCCNLSAQPDRYILNGSATRNNCNCYTLTTATNNQAGSVWNKIKIDISEAFDFNFNVYLGCLDANGADGMVFVMQPISTSIGEMGGGMGFSGIRPSVGIALDTWQNTDVNDPAFDHISIQLNGVTNHLNDLAGPVPASAASDNIEDCQWHLFRIVWDPATKWLRSYFDGVLRVEANIDLIKDVFHNDPLVYWGFSAATGGAINLQQFCTALNPKNISTPETSCIQPGGNTVSFTDKSESFAAITDYYWDFGDGSTSIAPNPPPHVYTQPGTYKVKMAITGKDGCYSDTLTKNVVVGSVPKADFSVYDTCEKANVRITHELTNETGNISTRKWIIDGSTEQLTLLPDLHLLIPGTHSLALQLTSEYGCSSTIISKNFVINERPQVNAVVADGCIKVPVSFKGNLINNQITISKWNWSFGDGQRVQEQNPDHIYRASGNFKANLWAIANNGCSSDTISNEVYIEKAIAHAGPDTLVLKNVPFMLNGGGNGSFLWSPSEYLNSATLAKPSAVLNDDRKYTLTVTSPLGCTATDEVYITVFKGSAIYVPNAFTPNNDGLNDILKPAYIGIKTLGYFTIYNRWGEVIFNTQNLSKGWDGTINGKPVSSGTFVWVLKATDYVGKEYQMKGTTSVIR